MIATIALWLALSGPACPPLGCAVSPNPPLELLQVAAVAVAALEAHGLVMRPESEEHPHG